MRDKPVAAKIILTLADKKASGEEFIALSVSLYRQNLIFSEPRELTNYKKGKLNLEGENVRKQLSDYFKIPVYFKYFIVDPDEDHPCLVCGQKGSDSGLKSPSQICKTCNTIFGYTEK